MPASSTGQPQKQSLPQQPMQQPRVESQQPRQQAAVSTRQQVSSPIAAISSSSSQLLSMLVGGPARNGLIMGTNKDTFNECNSKMLYGLPASHRRTLQKHVIPNNTLVFIFNYT
jgi:hypothetical protein